MCGIAGIFNFRSGAAVTRTQIETMCATLRHRGPDGAGIYLNQALGLGHRRLTIIDTSDMGAQPMKWADESLVITFNGEIYNYLELRSELVDKGYVFRSKSDTEVLLAMYREYGVSCLQRLNGMFAFAIWDSRTQSLFAARDRLGIKPFFYAKTVGGVYFASEIKAILAVEGNAFSTDHRLLDSYMSVGYCPGNETMFSQIKRLPPGHFFVATREQFHVQPFWNMEYTATPDKGEAYYYEKGKWLIEDAVRLQLRSDVPLGVFLSGGVDSSAVVATMRRLGVSTIKTFSVRWDHGSGFDESHYARQVAKRYATEHHDYTMRATDFVDFLPDYIRCMDEPVTEGAAISLYYLALKARQEVTVILSGEGADEVFGGYPIYRYFDYLRRYHNLPQGIRQWLLNPLLRCFGHRIRKYVDLSEQSLEACYFGVSFHDENMKRTLYTPEFAALASEFSVAQRMAPYYAATTGLALQSRMQYVDLKTWLVDDLLVKADRMSMAASLELRVPFLDHRLLEFVATLPGKYRFRKGQSKYLLKKIFEGELPKKILYRRKMGFPTPLTALFRGELKDYIADILDCPRTHQRGLFDPGRVRQLIGEHRSGKMDHQRILWQLLVLELWHREYADR